MMKKIGFLLFACLMFSICASAQSIVGKWKTIDDNTNKARSVVEIYEQDGKYFGRIINVFWNPDESPDNVCEKCTDDRKNQKIVGLQIIRNMEKKGSEYKNGKILDPENGKVYDCKIWIENGVLKVRGYVAFFFRTQTWYKYE
ncbi:MAG: DUF2147 domain-containing protein [Thermoflexibacter sp.]|jgi:uncharacterized protein (DUF2147 family)|nr:DUF2147 domain-containing protein [Thermoflexibacter sp.]